MAFATRLGVILMGSLGLTLPVQAAQVVRDTPVFFSSGDVLDQAMVSDRYLGALVEVGDSVYVQVLDTETWTLVSSAAGSNLLEPCLDESAADPATASAANGIFGFEVQDSNIGFYVTCDAGRLTQVTLTDAGDGDVTFAHESGQLTNPSGVAVDAGLVDGAFLVVGTAYTPYVLSRDRSIYTLNVENFGVSSAINSALATLSPSATQLAVGPVASTGSLPTFAVRLGDGTVRFLSSDGIAYDAGCASSAQDILIASTRLFVAALGDAPGVGVVDLSAPSAGCQDLTPLEGVLAGGVGLAFSSSTSDGTGTLYASGPLMDGSGDGIVAVSIPSVATGGEADAPISVGDAGGLSAGSPAVDLLFHQTGQEARLIADAPFVTLEAEILQEEDSTQVSDDEDATATPEVVTVLTNTLSLVITADEGGTVEASFAGDDLTLETTTVVAGQSIEASVELDSELEQGIYPLIVTVTDAAGNVGQVTRYLSLDTPPDELSGFDVGFGDGKLHVYWDEPSESDVATYQVVVAIGTEDEAPFTDGAEVLASAAAYSFTVVGTGTPVTYPDDVSETGEWPLTYSPDALETVREDGQRLYHLVISPLTNGVHYYVSLRAVDAEGQAGPWSDAKGATPEGVTGAAGISGDQGGFCAIVPAKGPGRAGGILVALGLLTYLGLRGRRRSDPLIG